MHRRNVEIGHGGRAGGCCDRQEVSCARSTIVFVYLGTQLREERGVVGPVLRAPAMHPTRDGILPVDVDAVEAVGCHELDAGGSKCATSGFGGGR